MPLLWPAPTWRRTALASMGKRMSAAAMSHRLVRAFGWARSSAFRAVEGAVLAVEVGEPAMVPANVGEPKELRAVAGVRVEVALSGATGSCRGGGATGPAQPVLAAAAWTVSACRARPPSQSASVSSTQPASAPWPQSSRHQCPHRPAVGRSSREPATGLPPPGCSQTGCGRASSPSPRNRRSGGK